MNKARRRSIDRIQAQLLDLIEELRAIHEEEQDAIDNIPESLLESDRAQRMQEGADLLETQLDTLEEVAGELQSIVEDSF